MVHVAGPALRKWIERYGAGTTLSELQQRSRCGNPACGERGRSEVYAEKGWAAARYPIKPRTDTDG